MSSSAAASRSVRPSSRTPPWQTVRVGIGSQIVGMGDARDRAAGTSSQAPRATTTGQVVQAQQTVAIPLGSGGDSFDVDQEAWDDAMAGAAGGDALVEYARYVSRVGVPTQGVIADVPPGMPTRGVLVDLPPVPKTPERAAGAQSMAERGRRTRSPKSTLRTMVAAGRPPMEQLVQAFAHPSTPQARRVMPLTNRCSRCSAPSGR